MKKNFSVKTISLKQMPAFAQRLQDSFKKPQLLLLEGLLGAGKTTLVRFLLESLKSAKEQVSSPAFAVQNTYKTSFGRVEHIDLYRLKDSEDLESTGFWDIFAEGSDGASLVIIEWANRLNPNCLPTNWNSIKVLCLGGERENTRDMQVEFLN